MKPAQYWRSNKDWNEWLGRTGQVLAVTTIRTGSPEFAYLVPYSYALVDFNGEKKEMLATGNDMLKIGDSVICVLRKMGRTDEKSIIDYGLKVQKLTERT